ncbi:hypothetical protein HK098_000682, partial [Nowakowskiella sp. JEL0407]
MEQSEYSESNQSVAESVEYTESPEPEISELVGVKSTRNSISGKSILKHRDSNNLLTIPKKSQGSIISASSKISNSSSTRAVSSTKEKEKRVFSRRPTQVSPDYEQTVNPSVVLERAIQEENKRTLAKVTNSERDEKKTELTYDQDGKLIPLLRINPSKLGSFG